MTDILKELKVGWSSIEFKRLLKSIMTSQWNEASEIKREKACCQSHTVAYLSRTLYGMDCLLLSKTQEAIKRRRLCCPADPLLKCVLFSESRVRMIVICDKAAQAHWRVEQECVWRLKREIRLEDGVAQMLQAFSRLKHFSLILRTVRSLHQQHYSQALEFTRGSDGIPNV